MASKQRLVVIGGTRPEALKLAPVVMQLRKRDDLFETLLVSTQQHPTLFRRSLEIFGLQPDVELAIAWPGNHLHRAAGAAISAIGDFLDTCACDRMILQGDTTSAFSAAVAALHHRIPVAHVEAGLRSGDRYSPFPEEMNSRLISRIADLHFAPTTAARSHLLSEGIATTDIVVTGNTIVDALNYALTLPSRSKIIRQLQQLPYRIVLASAHRRENFGDPLRRVCHTLRRAVDTFPNLYLAYCLHPNPQASEPASAILRNHPRISLIPPLPYPDFVRLMAMSNFIVTDSSGIQEEAPSLCKPVLVLRDRSERSEGIDAGIACLVGTQPAAVFAGVEQLVNNSALYDRMSSGAATYGDGAAGSRILRRLVDGPPVGNEIHPLLDASLPASLSERTVN